MAKKCPMPIRGGYAKAPDGRRDGRRKRQKMRGEKEITCSQKQQGKRSLGREKDREKGFAIYD